MNPNHVRIPILVNLEGSSIVTLKAKPGSAGRSGRYLSLVGGANREASIIVSIPQQRGRLGFGQVVAK
jgi:hypothetical protein